MAYSDFTLPQVLQTFRLTAQTTLNLFSQVPDAPVSPTPRDFLDKNATLALLINTEKARSEVVSGQTRRWPPGTRSAASVSVR